MGWCRIKITANEGHFVTSWRGGRLVCGCGQIAVGHTHTCRDCAVCCAEDNPRITVAARVCRARVSASRALWWVPTDVPVPVKLDLV